MLDHTRALLAKEVERSMMWLMLWNYAVWAHPPCETFVRSVSLLHRESRVCGKRKRSTESLPLLNTPRKITQKPLPTLETLRNQLGKRYVELLCLWKTQGALMTARERHAHEDDLESILLWLALSSVIVNGNCKLKISLDRALKMTYMGGWRAHLLLQASSRKTLLRKMNVPPEFPTPARRRDCL